MTNSKLKAGQTITATSTYTLYGVRKFRTREYFVLHDSQVERDFIPAGEGRPVQARIFVQHSIHHDISTPILVVQDSIEVKS